MAMAVRTQAWIQAQGMDDHLGWDLVTSPDQIGNAPSAPAQRSTPARHSAPLPARPQCQAWRNNKVEKLERGRAETETNRDCHRPAQRAGCTNSQSERAARYEQACNDTGRERTLAVV